MIFQQLFDPVTSTYTYLLADPDSKDGVIIDSVLEHFNRDFSIIQDLGINLKWILETHVHADHVTGASSLRDKTWAKVGFGKETRVTCADQLFEDGDIISAGNLSLKIILTPGHTNGCTSYQLADHAVFTGDALMINGCGRTDFQEGSSEGLCHSVREKLFSLPDSTLVYPAHDYHGRTSSTIGNEKKSNARLKLSNSKEQFFEIMKNLKLDRPKQIDRAVPANMKCGKI